MKKSFILSAFVIVAFALLPALASAQTMLPFPVKVEDKPAVLAKDSDAFARIAEAVAADSELEVVIDGDVPMVIINAFPSDAAGTAKEGATPAIILGQNTKKVKLDATMDKKKLEPGFYILNIVAGEKTSRVLLQVK